MKTCIWVKSNGVCGKKTSYRYVDTGRESGATKVRDYDSLCDQHRLAVFNHGKCNNDECSICGE